VHVQLAPMTLDERSEGDVVPCSRCGDYRGVLTSDHDQSYRASFGSASSAGS
jgi:hypothetical protein